ncbi:MAG: GNAT family N-acetyltransferase [Candidatus Cloacimonetes bacterium]|nr:GNAT family N-acetyltransferase [Candidatus Cloacimonadota bacterium]
MAWKKAFESFPVLETNRFRLRRPVESDARRMYEIYSEPDVVRFLDWNGPDSEETARLVIRYYNEQYLRKTALRWVIADKESNVMAGMCMLAGFVTPKTCEVGYDLHKDWWGKGAMTEVLQRVTEYCFAELELTRIQALVQPGNIASAKLLEKLGFEREGLLRQYGYHEDNKQTNDVEIYSLIQIGE